MPMIEGEVIVDPLTGATTGFGAAKEVFDVIDEAANYGDFSGADLGVAKEGNAVIARAVAKIIPHIQTNAQVTTSVGTTVAAGIPVATAGTAVAQTGATTAPGAGTGSGSGTVA